MPADELGATMAPGVGIAGTALLTRKPVVLERYGDVANPARPDSLDNPVIGVPIEWQGKMIGFFGVGVDAGAARRAGRPVRLLGADDVAALSIFARHAAIAIQHVRRHKREEQRSERLRLIARIGHVIAANLNLADLLQSTADSIHELLGYPNVAIPLLECGPPDVLVLKTVGGFYKDIVRGEYRLPVTTGIMGAAARTGTLQLVNDVTADPRHLPTPGATGITAELAVPIRLGGRILGVVNVESSQPFDEEDAASLEIVADHLAVAIENVRLYDRGQVLAVLEERQRLARELHDSVTQHIFGINLIAQSLGGAWRRDEVEAERRIARMLELSQTALAEMRALLTELRPMTERWVVAQEPARAGIALVRQSGLVAALTRHVTDLSADGPNIQLDAARYHAQSLDTEEELFRIVQEALNNIVKHARAKRVIVQLSAGSTELSVIVLDDGCGFTPPAAGSPAKSGGLGLSTMRERALRLGGALEVQSTPGAGTRVAARLPLPVLVSA